MEPEEALSRQKHNGATTDPQSAGRPSLCVRHSVRRAPPVGGEPEGALGATDGTKSGVRRVGGAGGVFVIQCLSGQDRLTHSRQDVQVRMADTRAAATDVSSSSTECSGGERGEKVSSVRSAWREHIRTRFRQSVYSN